MKFKYLFILLFSVFIASCSTKKQVVNKSRSPAKYKVVSKNSVPKTTTNSKVISENTLVNKYSADEYIARYKAIAITEMNSYGIPASITLAQGLLESGNGNASLAREANNHFGIKCTSDWNGKTIFKDDDKKDDCFRVYRTPEESFQDHSQFLKRKRYAALFELDKDDYEGWARGLKQAGYATNPKYPELLISLVQRYNLDQYDRREKAEEKVKREEKTLAEIFANAAQENKEEPAKPTVVMQIYEVKQGDTMYSIAKRFSLTVDDLKILNNLQNTDIKLGQLLLVSK